MIIVSQSQPGGSLLDMTGYLSAARRCRLPTIIPAQLMLVTGLKAYFFCGVWLLIEIKGLTPKTGIFLQARFQSPT